MASFLSRIFRRRSDTQPSAHSVSPSQAPAFFETTPNPGVSIDAISPTLSGLKIRSNLNSLLESFETVDGSPNRQSEGRPVAVPPSSIQGDSGYRPLSPNPNISRNVATRPLEPGPPQTPVSTEQPTLPVFAGAFPLGGTFGRQQISPASFSSTRSGSPHKVPARSWSLGDSVKVDLTEAQRLSSLTPTSQLPLSGTFERSSSVRSLPDRRRINQRRRANTRSLSSLRTNRSTPSGTPRLNRTPPPVTRSESPRTFGHPTPPHSTHTFGRHESPAPPLPSLNHPELILDARGLKLATFGRPYESPNSATAIHHVDGSPGTPKESASGSSARRKPTTRKRSKTDSVDSRRSSAEWSSVQATEGVLTNSNSWQAQVSRELLRLSLRGPTALLRGEDPGNSRDVSHVPATRLELSAETFTLPHPSPSLGFPLFLQGPRNIFNASVLLD